MSGARIEVANNAQVAHAMVYFRPLREALLQAREAVSAAARVGHLRAEMNARAAAGRILFALGDFEPCRNEHLKAHDLARRLGALRFEQPCLLFLGRIAHEEGEQQLAVENLRQAEEVAQRTSLAFHGPMIFGALAFVLDRPDDRRAALAQAESIIGQGCVSHNQLWFYPDAIDVALELFDFDAAERYVSALEDFTRAEPLPWSDFFVARGRALIAIARGPSDPDIRAALQRLLQQGEQFGYAMALPALREPLARVDL